MSRSKRAEQSHKKRSSGVVLARHTRRVLEQQRTNGRVSVKGVYWWTLGLDG